MSSFCEDHALTHLKTMAHQPMHINDWIEIDKDLKWYIDEKARVIKEQGLLLSNIWRYLPPDPLVLLQENMLLTRYRRMTKDAPN